MEFSARLIVTWPSSSGWRSTSSVVRLNSGSSSRNNTPLWARLISPGVGVEPPPTRPALLDRVMRRAKRPPRQQRLAWRQPADRAVDSRCLDRLVRRQHRQDRRHALGQHGLAGTRRADHQQIMAAGGGDRDRPLGHLLAADVGEVFVVVRQLLEQFIEPRGRRFDVELAGEKGDRLRRGYRPRSLRSLRRPRPRRRSRWER